MTDQLTPEVLAQRFHETYERLAPSFGYETREASAKPWAEVPENNRRLMTAVCAEVLAAELDVMTADRDSEQRWADHYFRDAESLRAQLQATAGVATAARALSERFEDGRVEADEETDYLIDDLDAAVKRMQIEAPDALAKAVKEAGDGAHQ